MLVPAALASALADLFSEPSMPASQVEALQRWGTAYVSYASLAMAGPVVPVSLQFVALSDENFFVALDNSLSAMWHSAAFVGPAATGTALVVPPLLPFLVGPAAALLSVTDPSSVPSVLATALHTYTLSIVVSVVPASGTPVPTPLL